MYGTLTKPLTKSHVGMHCNTPTCRVHLDRAAIGLCLAVPVNIDVCPLLFARRIPPSVMTDRHLLHR